ncbi:DUF5715 family protein [Gordonia sp. DT30]|uniref:DUF5715 family protein n=1 Tax=unclassified Gordonia (in: high G+C Gram-positive bacteria) TaxID=2657482 RepID=UPI003CED7FD5
MTNPVGARVITPAAAIAFRAGVERLAAAIDGCPTGVEDSLIRRELSEPDLYGIVGQFSDADFRIDELVEAARRFRPTDNSTASTTAAMVKVQLLSMLDAVWCAGHSPYATDEEVRSATDLVDLVAARCRGELRFDFRVQIYDRPRRVVRAADRRLLSGRSPRTIGMRLPYARPAMVSLLNSIADDFASACPRAPRLWVNSTVRSASYQKDMRSAGYLAVSGSSHCVGWAADIEMAWMAARGHADVLAAILTSRAATGRVNVIDEGQAWHLCLDPDPLRPESP